MKLVEYQKDTDATDTVGDVLLIGQEQAKEFFAREYPALNAQMARLTRLQSGRMELTPEGAYLILLNIPENGENKITGNIGVYTDFEKRCVMIVGSLGATDALRSKLSDAHSYAGAVCLLLEAVTANDYLALEEIEKSVNLLEEKLIEDKAPDNTVNVIVDYRKRLMRLKQFYEQLTEILEGFTINKVPMPPRDRATYQNLLGRLNRLLGRVRDLRDGVSQVREAYQAQVDIGQNRLMKLFTVITAIFMPLQLIVGWYGMNLIMPETALKITYPIVIAVCAGIVILCFLLFKRRKMF